RFNLPDLGEGLQEAEIVRWHVAEGDTVAIDQPMVAMETAKAVVEVPAPWAGVVQALHGKPGDTIATGAPLVDFHADAEADNADAAGASSSAVAPGEAPLAAAAAPAHTAGTEAPPALARGGVVGHMPETGAVLEAQ